MKKQVFFIHGGDSFSQTEDFLRYLKTTTLRDLPGTPKSAFWKETFAEDLGEGFEVFMPRMPNSQNAHYEEWKIWFERHFEYLLDGVILVGWSLGGMFLAKYLSENATPFENRAVFLISAPFGYYDDDSGNDCGSFRFSPENVTKLSRYGDKMHFWHSKDDFVVPYQHVLEYQKYLPVAQLHIFEDKNHFLIEEFPELLAAIKEI